jgi:hypothetical protein
MTVGLATAGFAISLLCALIMGYAIQRGATCTVAAVSQLVDQGKWGRFVGLIEAALWVAGGLLLARALGFLPNLPAGQAVTTATFFGGILLGAGAYVNKACVFGTVAKIGARVVSLLRSSASSASPELISKLVSLPELAVGAFLLFAIWRIFNTVKSDGRSLAERIWAPHEATVVIGITFAIMFVAAGAWAYTDLLAELAIGMPGDVLERLLLLCALFMGSIIGGSTSSGALPFRFDPRGVVRTFAGGAAMGAGSLLIPGSNDGLILVGMPLLYPYAWVGIATMCLTITAALGAERLRARLRINRHAAD